MTIEYIIPKYACVMWDGTNIEEMQTAFPLFQFGDSAGILTVFGQGYSGNVDQGAYLFAVPPPANLNISYSHPSEGPNYISAPTE
jgi:hypothetical protein